MQAFIDARFELNDKRQEDWDGEDEDVQHIILASPKGDLRTNVTVFRSDEDKEMDGFYAVAMHPDKTVRLSEFRADKLAIHNKYTLTVGDHHTVFMSQAQFEHLYQSMTELREQQRQYRR